MVIEYLHILSIPILALYLAIRCKAPETGYVSLVLDPVYMKCVTDYISIATETGAPTYSGYFINAPAR